MAAAAAGDSLTPLAAASAAIHAWRSRARDGGVVLRTAAPAALAASVSALARRPPPPTSTSSVRRQRIAEVGDERGELVGR